MSGQNVAREAWIKLDEVMLDDLDDFDDSELRNFENLLEHWADLVGTQLKRRRESGQ